MRASVATLLLLVSSASAYHVSPSPSGEAWSDSFPSSPTTTDALLGQVELRLDRPDLDALLGQVDHLDLPDLDSRLARSPILLMWEEEGAGSGLRDGGDAYGQQLLSLRAETRRIRDAVEPMREMLCRTVRRAAEAECASNLMLVFVVGCLLSLSCASSRRARDAPRAPPPASASPIVVIAQPADEEAKSLG